MENKLEIFLFFILLINTLLSISLGDMFAFLGWATACFIQFKACYLK